MVDDLNPYKTLPSIQKKLYDDSGAHAGYRIAVTLEKEGVQASAEQEVWMTSTEASALAGAPDDEFTAWYSARITEYALVDKAVAKLP